MRRAILMLLMSVLLVQPAAADGGLLGQLRSLAEPTPAMAGSVLVGFTPAGRGLAAEDVVLRAIQDADRTLRVAVFSFTSSRIAKALVAAHKRGIRVGVILDDGQNKSRYSAGTFIANQGIPTRINSQYGHMHQKFAVVDDEGVVTGSFNWTSAAAERNAENVLYLPKSVDVANAYRAEWLRLWDEAVEMPPRY